MFQRGLIMSSPARNPHAIEDNARESTALSLRSVVRKSALLNLAIVLTSFPVLAFAAGPNALIPILKVMAGITVVIWAATFSLFSFASLGRLFGAPAPRGKHTDPPGPGRESGVADRWLDQPG
jgi:hypothetical protein